MRPLPAPTHTDLPPDVGCRIAPGVLPCDDGRTLVADGRVLRLSARAAGLVRPDGVVRPGAGPALVRRLLDTGAAVPWWETSARPDAAVDDVTVVVPVRDRPAALDRLLAALPAHLPVVVVDDGSLDPGATARVCHRHGSLLVRHRTARGPSAARNSGLGHVHTPYVAFCDSDVEPEPGWLGVLRRHLDDPSVGLAAPRVLGLRPRPGEGRVARYERARSSLDLGPRPAAVRPGGRVAYVPSACLVARVAALGAGFDPGMESGEDVDLVWRLAAAGWQVRYDPDAQVRHDHRCEPGPWLARKAFYGTSAAPLARRHRGAVAPAVLTPWSATVTVALLAQRPWSAPLAAAAGAVALGGIARRLDTTPRRWRVASVLVGQGVQGCATQTASLLLRHHWPLALLWAAVSPRGRRAWLVAAVADGLLDHRRLRPDLAAAEHLVLRRLDDLAYGWGLWAGVVREGSPRALLPRGGRLRVDASGTPVGTSAGVVRGLAATATVTRITPHGTRTP